MAFVPQPGHDDHGGHIPVYWLDKEVPPTRWERVARRLNDLPAGLCVIVIALVAIVIVQAPVLSISMPDVGVPSLSLPGDSFSASRDDDRESSRIANTAAIPPASVSRATPAQEVATPPGSILDLARNIADPPNELGRVPILMYHAFVHDPSNVDPWTLTFDQFREQLDWLREHDFVMAGVQSMIDGRFDVPAGKRPVILTFDDASSGQFGLRESPDGGYEVKPDTAVGVLEAYAAEYPEFAGPAFFAVLPFNCFASDDDPSTCKERLNWLVEHGYEVGNHTASHDDLTDVSPDSFTKSIGSMMMWINERVPQGPGNLSRVLVLPYGAYPDIDLHPDERSWLSEGFWYLGEPVDLLLVMDVAGGPAISPYSSAAHPVDTYRINTEPERFTYFQEQVKSGEVSIFVSDGDPEVVSVPAKYEDEVDTNFLERKGLELRVYGDAGEAG